MPVNSAAAVRGPKHVTKTGKTPALDGREWRKLIDAIPTETVRDLRKGNLFRTSRGHTAATLSDQPMSQP